METNKIYNEPCLETLKRMPNDSKYFILFWFI